MPKYNYFENLMFILEDVIRTVKQCGGKIQKMDYL